MRQRFADFIGAGDIDHRHGVRGRLDAGDVEFAQFLDVAEDIAELRAKFDFFFRRQLNAREMRDVFDVYFCGSHSMSFKLNAESFKFNFENAGGK